MACLYGLKETDGLIWWELRTAGQAWRRTDAAEQDGVGSDAKKRQKPGGQALRDPATRINRRGGRPRKPTLPAAPRAATSSSLTVFST